MEGSLVGSLHKGDRELLLKKISEICDYNESSFDTIANNKESESHMMNLFFFISHNTTAGIIKQNKQKLGYKK